MELSGDSLIDSELVAAVEESVAARLPGVLVSIVVKSCCAHHRSLRKKSSCFVGIVLDKDLVLLLPGVMMVVAQVQDVVAMAIFTVKDDELLTGRADDCIGAGSKEASCQC